MVTPVDTTGAGDTFCGSLCAALSQGASMPDALRYASAAGALACTRLGAQSSVPTTDEVQALMQAQPHTNTPAQQAALATQCGLN